MDNDRFPTAPLLPTQEEWITRTERPNRIRGGNTERSAELQAVDAALGEYDSSRDRYNRALAAYVRIPAAQRTDLDSTNVIDRLDAVARDLGNVGRALDAWNPARHQSRNGQGALTDLSDALQSEHARTFMAQREALTPLRDANRQAALTTLESGPARPARRAAPTQAGPSRLQAPARTAPAPASGTDDRNFRSHWSSSSDGSSQGAVESQSLAARGSEPQNPQMGRSEWYDSMSASGSPEPPTPTPGNVIGGSTTRETAPGPRRRPAPSDVPASEVSIPSSPEALARPIPDVPRSTATSPASTQESGVPLSVLFGNSTPSQSSAERSQNNGPPRRDPTRRRSESEQDTPHSVSPGKGKGHGRR